MTWTHRLYLICAAADVEALTQLAIETSQSQAEQHTFHEVLPGWYGTNTAATESIRTALNDGLAILLASGSVGTIYVARLDNATDILQSSYSASPLGYGNFGGTIGEVWTFDEAVQTLEQLT